MEGVLFCYFNIPKTLCEKCEFFEDVIILRSPRMYSKNPKKTTIAIDYDDTITLVPLFFKEMIEKWKHAIDFHIVTYRSQNGYDDKLREFEELTGHKVIFTDAKAKRDVFQADIWIDDRPISITHDFSDFGFIPSKQTEALYLKKNKCVWHMEITNCHNDFTRKEKEKFTFCPWCGGKII